MSHLESSPIEEGHGSWAAMSRRSRAARTDGGLDFRTNEVLTVAAELHVSSLYCSMEISLDPVRLDGCTSMVDD